MAASSPRYGTTVATKTRLERALGAGVGGVHPDHAALAAVTSAAPACRTTRRRGHVHRKHIHPALQSETGRRRVRPWRPAGTLPWPAPALDPEPARRVLLDGRPLQRRGAGLDRALPGSVTARVADRCRSVEHPEPPGSRLPGGAQAVSLHARWHPA